MQELDSPVMVIIREHSHISPHVFHDHREMLKHGIYGLTGDMSEVPVFSPVRFKESSLNLSVPGEDHVWFEDRWMVASLYDE
jgi:hypothetical protein